MKFDKVMWATVTLVACAASKPGTANNGIVVSATAPATIVTIVSATASATNASPPHRCPIVPMELVLTLDDGSSSTDLALDATGTVKESLLGTPKDVARLDPRGCLVSPDGVEIELERGSRLWTPYVSLPFTGSTLDLGDGRALRISANGVVETLDAVGGVEKRTHGGLAFKGYNERAACAATMLLAMSMMMMPSMASVDGHPVTRPAPEDSVCPELPRRKR